MSGHVAGWVLANSETNGVLRLVLLVLAENAANDGRHGIRLSVLARHAALPGEREAEQALELLARDGHIELDERPKAESVIYTVVYPGNDLGWREAHCEPIFAARCGCQFEEMVRAG